jgi:hypothetical protein
VIAMILTWAAVVVMGGEGGAMPLMYERNYKRESNAEEDRRSPGGAGALCLRGAKEIYTDRQRSRVVVLWAAGGLEGIAFVAVAAGHHAAGASGPIRGPVVTVAVRGGAAALPGRLDLDVHRIEIPARLVSFIAPRVRTCSAVGRRLPPCHQ